MDLMQFLSKRSQGLFSFVDIDKIILKCMWIDKGIKSSFKHNFENNNKVGTFSLPNFRTYSIVLIRKIVWYLQKDRHIDQ